MPNPDSNPRHIGDQTGLKYVRRRSHFLAEQRPKKLLDQAATPSASSTTPSPPCCPEPVQGSKPPSAGSNATSSLTTRATQAYGELRDRGLSHPPGRHAKGGCLSIASQISTHCQPSNIQPPTTTPQPLIARYYKTPPSPHKPPHRPTAPRCAATG